MPEPMTATVCALDIVKLRAFVQVGAWDSLAFYELFGLIMTKWYKKCKPLRISTYFSNTILLNAMMYGMLVFVYDIPKTQALAYAWKH